MVTNLLLSPSQVRVTLVLFIINIYAHCNESVPYMVVILCRCHYHWYQQHCINIAHNQDLHTLSRESSIVTIRGTSNIESTWLEINIYLYGHESRPLLLPQAINIIHNQHLHTRSRFSTPLPISQVSTALLIIEFASMVTRIVRCHYQRYQQYVSILLENNIYIHAQCHYHRYD